MKGEGVEEDETANAERGGAVFFLIGFGNQVGNAMSGSRVTFQLASPPVPLDIR